MPATSEKVRLTASQAACLDAVLQGLNSKTNIAVETKKDLNAVAAALEGLKQARLIRQTDSFRWRATKRGQTSGVQIVSDPERRLGGKSVGRIVPGSATERLIDALDRPMRGKDLSMLLGVSHQGVHQIVVRLLAQDKVRVGDRAHIHLIVARPDDPSVLLTHDEERVLSALPERETTATGIAAATHLSIARVEELLEKLRGCGLVEDAGTRRNKALHRLTSEGIEHFQRRKDARRAKPPRLAVRSDRVRDVLSYLSDHRAARIMELRDALGIAQASMNALMQYLKRKRLVTKVGGELTAPYELTDEGRRALAEMSRLAA